MNTMMVLTLEYLLLLRMAQADHRRKKSAMRKKDHALVA